MHKNCTDYVSLPLSLSLSLSLFLSFFSLLLLIYRFLSVSSLSLSTSDLSVICRLFLPSICFLSLVSMPLPYLSFFSSGTRSTQRFPSYCAATVAALQSSARSHSYTTASSTTLVSQTATARRRGARWTPYTLDAGCTVWVGHNHWKKAFYDQK